MKMVLSVSFACAIGCVSLASLADESGAKGDWTVSGDVIVDAAGVTCSSIKFAGNAKISGGPVTLGAGGITVGDGVTAEIASVIAGSENFAVTAADRVNRRADWYVDPANGKVSIPSGVTLRGHNLYFKTADGWQPQMGGDFTSENSSFVTGGGTLRMTGNSGLILFIR